MKKVTKLLAPLAFGLLAAGCFGSGTTTTVSPSPQPMTASPAPTPSPTPADATVKSFTVEGKNFSFSPSTLTVNKGDTVKITFNNTGSYPHNWGVDEFTGARTQIVQPGQSDTIQFVADKAGSFEFYCSVANHKAMGMVGNLTVK